MSISPVEPSKKIFDASDLARFRKSIAFERLHIILHQVINKVKGCEVPAGVLNEELVTRPSRPPAPPWKVPPRTSLSAPELIIPQVSEYAPNPPTELSTDSATVYDGVVDILANFNALITSTPPQVGPRRFGNLAFRTWHDKINVSLEELISKHIGASNMTSSETSYYLKSSFGSALRLDFGTGHELSFLAFLGGVGVAGSSLIESCSGSQLLTIFGKYYDVVRRLILVYSLEPAGSHGVWGLDDHFHLIYIIGAAQFNKPENSAGAVSAFTVPPVSSILTLQTIKAYKLTNLYVSGIAFIYKIKSGPFNEHSPIIFDIHNTVFLWAKVLSGLVKMFEVEVLGKFPVVQHFWFGNVLYPWRDLETNKELPVYKKEEEDTAGGDEPGFLDGTGVRTTRTNISMTGAPWARR